MNFDESRLVVYNSAEECDELFSNGSIAAAFDEIPYIELFLAKYCSKYTMVGPTYKTDGFSFVFLIGSPLVPDVSRAILNITEGEKMVQIEKKWLGDSNNKCAESTNVLSSNSLGLESFKGLFLIVGIAAFSVIFIYVIMFLHEHWHVLTDSNQEFTTLSKIIVLLQRFDNRDSSSHTFRSIYLKECHCGDDEAEEKAMGSPENLQESPYSFSPTSL
ncbi:hypothetical protein C2S51_017707 [Perilla frutescens var. frutescens]|nr:hypothetical protein C2S51_017707 [Perilla frutescens var. frutescens]